jgi:type II secretory ATPase GspE/PulE/Tfp pilus assembly ATPase PilB-like protein
MIGEIRDEETAEIAVRSAITGHLVFSTLHTNDAPGAILRLGDMGVQRYLLADALVGVIAQRLVKKLCPACKKKGRTTVKEMELLGIDEPVCVGPLSRAMAACALEEGMAPESVHTFDDAAGALAAVRALLGEGDAVLVKASHSIGLEAVVEGLVK